MNNLSSIYIFVISRTTLETKIHSHCNRIDNLSHYIKLLFIQSGGHPKAGQTLYALIALFNTALPDAVTVTLISQAILYDASADGREVFRQMS